MRRSCSWMRQSSVISASRITAAGLGGDVHDRKPRIEAIRLARIACTGISSRGDETPAPGRGAHYTDRDKIMLLVEPVVVRPLLAEWDAEKTEIRVAHGAAEPVRRGEAPRPVARPHSAAEPVRGEEAAAPGPRPLNLSQPAPKATRTWPPFRNPHTGREGAARAVRGFLKPHPATPPHHRETPARGEEGQAPRCARLPQAHPAPPPITEIAALCAAIPTPHRPQGLPWYAISGSPG